MPPGFCDMMIGKDDSIAPYEKTGAESIDPETRPPAPDVELGHSLIVHQRLAGGVYRHLEWLSRFSFAKFHNDVQKADAWSIFLNDVLRNLAFLLQQCQAILCFLELLLQDRGIRTV